MESPTPAVARTPGRITVTTVLLTMTACMLSTADSRSSADDTAPDMASVAVDLVPPTMTTEPPEAGRRVRVVVPGYESTGVFYSLYLPRDWNEDQNWPVLIELPGNGPFQNAYGDVCTGRVEDCCLGYGLSGGARFIWVCAPFLNDTGTQVVTRWWGDPPHHSRDATVTSLIRLVDSVCTTYGGDPDRIILCGFSRGSIACNTVGLHNAEIAGLWRAMILCSHYDGVHEGWGYPGADRVSALRRLQRLGDRPQFVLHEISGDRRTNLQATRAYLAAVGHDTHVTFALTGFRNHSDHWILRPGPARKAVRDWLTKIAAE